MEYNLKIIKNKNEINENRTEEMCMILQKVLISDSSLYFYRNFLYITLCFLED